MVETVGTCYEDAWRFLLKEEEGELIHGSVQLSAEGPRVSHAWVELPTGYIWEPQTGSFFTIEDFKIMAPLEEQRYSVTEAAVMLARVGKHGPWTEQEREQFLKRGNPEDNDKRLLKVAIEREPLRVAKQLGYEIHRLSPTDIVDKADYASGYRFRLSKAVPNQPYPQIVMAHSEGEVVTFLKRQIEGNPGTPYHEQIICQRCNTRPAEKQDPTWVPICHECNEEIHALPHRQKLDEMQKEWDKFIQRREKRGPDKESNPSTPGTLYLEEGERIAQQLGNGVIYNGSQMYHDKIYTHFFTDAAVTGTTFACLDFEECKATLIQSRKAFGAAPPTFSGNPSKEHGAMEYMVDDIKVILRYERPGAHRVTIEAPGGRSITEEEGEKITKLIEEKTSGGGNPGEYITIVDPGKTVFNKGETPPLERLGGGQVVNDLLPMPPESGPPLPRVLGIRWPWKK